MEAEWRCRLTRRKMCEAPWKGGWGYLSRRLTGNLALEGYRQGRLSLAELDREAALQELADSNRQSRRG